MHEPASLCHTLFHRTEQRLCCHQHRGSEQAHGGRRHLPHHEEVGFPRGDGGQATGGWGCPVYFSPVVQNLHLTSCAFILFPGFVGKILKEPMFSLKFCLANPRAKHGDLTGTQYCSPGGRRGSWQHTGVLAAGRGPGIGQGSWRRAGVLVAGGGPGGTWGSWRHVGVLASGRGPGSTRGSRRQGAPRWGAVGRS